LRHWLVTLSEFVQDGATRSATLSSCSSGTSISTAAGLGLAGLPEEEEQQQQRKLLAVVPTLHMLMGNSSRGGKISSAEARQAWQQLVAAYPSLELTCPVAELWALPAAHFLETVIMATGSDSTISDNSNSTVGLSALQLRQLLSGYGLAGGGLACTQLHQALGGLDSLMQVQRLQQLLRECWEAVQGAAGSSSAAAAARSMPTYSRAECHVALKSIVGIAAADATLHTAREAERFDFCQLVNIVVQARRAPVSAPGCSRLCRNGWNVCEVARPHMAYALGTTYSQCMHGCLLPQAAAATAQQQQEDGKREERQREVEVRQQPGPSSAVAATPFPLPPVDSLVRPAGAVAASAGELSQLLISYGVPVGPELAEELLQAHMGLRRTQQAFLLQQLLRACWLPRLPMITDYNGCRSALKDVARRSLEGEAAVDRVLEHQGVEEGQQVGFEQLVRLALLVRREIESARPL
jgi:hypothetical protein